MKPAAFLACLALAIPAAAELSSLNLGLDYRLRGVAIDNNDTQGSTKDHLNYYSHYARAYLTAWLNENVEGSLRVQSINIWGLEGASAPLTRYPAADGSPWIEEAYIHMPHLASKRLDLKLGRQSIVLGDGMLVSDDQLGFNALRAKISLPKQMGLDMFTAKIVEGLDAGGDFDLLGAVFGLGQDQNRWEFGWIQEHNAGASTYQLASGTTTARSVTRSFYDIRLVGNLKDAYYRLEYAMQDGKAKLGPAGTEAALSGSAEKIELGAQTDFSKWGRFGVRAVYAAGTGDDPGTTDKDEGFRASFARRWDGLQRSGYGVHMGATVSDVYSSSSPFSSTSNGLPAGASGVKLMGLGLFTVQKVTWTAGLDYYIFDSSTKVSGLSALGNEVDFTTTWRYTGYVTFGFSAAYFMPGELYGPDASTVSRYTAEAHIHF